MDKKQLVKLVSAFVMADGGVYRRVKGDPKTSNANAYYMMNMLTKHMDYIEWVVDTLSEITSVTTSDVKNPCKQPQTRVVSRTHPFLTKIWGRVYIDGYKGLDPHAMKLFDWEMLAIFYMADGSLSVEQPNAKKGLINPSPNVTLNMKRLSYGDQLFLKQLIRDKLGVETNVTRQTYKGRTYYFLRVRNRDIDKFMKGIEPHMKESFYYKLWDSERKAPKG